MTWERERENSKILFYKDCSLSSVKKPVKQLVLVLVLISKYKITGIMYIHTGYNKGEGR